MCKLGMTRRSYDGKDLVFQEILDLKWNQYLSLNYMKASTDIRFHRLHFSDWLRLEVMRSRSWKGYTST